MPSTSRRPLSGTGANAPGTAMLARIATRVAAIEHQHLAAFDVGGDGPERDRQPVEIGQPARRRHDCAEQPFDLMRRTRPPGATRPPSFTAELEAVREEEVVGSCG